MLSLDLTIETNSRGEHVIVYPRCREDLVPPASYGEKLRWIRSSFRLFYEHICEVDVVRRAVKVN